MKPQVTLIALIFILTCAPVLSQRKATVPKRKVTKPAAAPRVPTYKLNLKIEEGSKLSVSIVSPEKEGAIEVNDLSELITDLPAGVAGFRTPNTVFPKVRVEPSPNISMLSFWNPLTLFRLDQTDFSVSIPGDMILSIPRATPDDSYDLKPNPLLLFVEIDEANNLRLNNEPAGTLSDTRALRERLMELFKARADNGVFHEGTNDVETETTIVMPMSDRKFADVITIAEALKKSGAAWINLTMESPIPVVESLDVLLPEPTPRRLKPRRN